MKKATIILIVLIFATANISFGSSMNIHEEKPVNNTARPHKYPVWILDNEKPTENQVVSIGQRGLRSPDENISMTVSIDKSDVYPGIERNISIKIKNEGNESKGPIGIMLELPFFLIVKNKKFYLENSSGTYEIDFEYVTITYPP